MRRKDREVTDPQRIEEIMQACHTCRIGLVDDGQAYIVPLNFAFVRENGVPCLYFHSAREGRKIDLIRATGKAGFEMDTNGALVSGERACDFSYGYQSVIGSGRIALVEEEAAKAQALTHIMAHYTGRADWTFEPQQLRAVAILRLEVTEMACKEHALPPR